MSVLEQNGIANFSMQELVHPYVADNYGEYRILHFLDLRVFKGWQWIRSARGNPIYLNTWALDIPGYPKYDDRGLRWHGKSDTGKQTSQHYFGRAGDGDEKGTTARELYNWIMKPAHQEKLLDIGVTTIEDIEYTKTWVHLDCRNWGFEQTELQVVSP